MQLHVKNRRSQQDGKERKGESEVLISNEVTSHDIVNEEEQQQGIKQNRSGMMWMKLFFKQLMMIIQTRLLQNKIQHFGRIAK